MPPHNPLPPCIEAGHIKLRKKLETIEYIIHKAWDVPWMIHDNNALPNKLYSKLPEIFLWEWEIDNISESLLQ